MDLPGAQESPRLAMAPAPPSNARLKGAVTPDAKVSWAADSHAERAGFEVLCRETTDPRWRVYEFVTESREAVLKGVSSDNHFFAGVRSAGTARVRLPADRNGAANAAGPTPAKQ